MEIGPVWRWPLYGDDPCMERIPPWRWPLYGDGPSMGMTLYGDDLSMEIVPPWRWPLYMHIWYDIWYDICIWYGLLLCDNPHSLNCTSLPILFSSNSIIVALHSCTIHKFIFIVITPGVEGYFNKLLVGHSTMWWTHSDVRFCKKWGVEKIYKQKGSIGSKIK